MCAFKIAFVFRSVSAHYQGYFSFNLALCHICVLFQLSLFLITLAENI